MLASGSRCAIVEQMSRIAANAVDTAVRAIGVRGWVLLCLTAVLCVGCGWVAARMAGFPFYHGFQGVFAQQPLNVSVAGLIAAAVSLAVATRLGVSLTLVADPRMGAALGLLALAGFALRGGSMASVLAAASGGETFFMLAGEMAVLGLLAWGAHLLTARMCRNPVDDSSLGGVAAGVAQLAVFALVMWVAGQSYLKGQAIGTVFVAGLVASWAAHMAIGKTWKHGWCVPIICGIVGYIANGFTGNTMPSLSGPAAAFAIASPLDYAAFGPIGIIFGELLHRDESSEKGEEPDAGSKRPARRRVRQ